MLVRCCDFCMKILKTDNEKYTYTVDYKQYELCENCYDDLVKIDDEKKEAINKAKDTFIGKLNKLEKRYRNENTKENNI